MANLEQLKNPLVAICRGTGAETRNKLFKAVVARSDIEMQGRLHFYSDLFAADGKYHKICYAKYISEKNIKFVQPKPLKEENPFEEALHTLFREVELTVLQKKESLTLNIFENTP